MDGLGQGGLITGTKGAVGVSVTVKVGVDVFVSVARGVNVLVTVFVMVLVGVDVAVLVAVEVTLRPWRAALASAASLIDVGIKSDATRGSRL